MTPGGYFFLSGAINFGIPLAFAVREMVVMRRARSGPSDGRRAPPPPAPAPLPTGGTPVARKLPDCLIPDPVALQDARERELA